MNRPSMRKANTAARDEAARRSSDDMVSAGYMKSPLRDKRRHFSMLVRSKQEFHAEPALTPWCTPTAAPVRPFGRRFLRGLHRNTYTVELCWLRVICCGYNFDTWGTHPQPEEH